MPIITSIVPQKSKKRVNIYLDNKFGFGIDLENYIKLNLKVEQSLKDSEVENIVKKAEFQKVLDRLVMFATLRLRSEKEISDWLKRKKVHESMRKELFNRLNRLQLINDKKFAQWWIEQRNSFRPRSINVLKLELIKKGIDKEIINETLSKIQINEKKDALNILNKKIYKFAKFTGVTRNQKMIAYLLTKGYSLNDAKFATNAVNRSQK